MASEVDTYIHARLHESDFKKPGMHLVNSFQQRYVHSYFKRQVLKLHYDPVFFQMLSHPKDTSTFETKVLYLGTVGSNVEHIECLNCTAISTNNKALT